VCIFVSRCSPSLRDINITQKYFEAREVLDNELPAEQS